MVEFRGGDKLRARLAQMATEVKRARTLQVGFMGGKTYPDGTLVATVAAFDEFGVPSHGQPPRPFMRGWVQEKSASWGKDLATLVKFHDYDAQAALEAMGAEMDGQLVQVITDYVGPPLAPSTIARKGFDKQLIDHSILINSVTSRVK